jgi:hypothetical protein
VHSIYDRYQSSRQRIQSFFKSVGGKAAEASVELAQLHRLPDIPLQSIIPPLPDSDLFTFQDISCPEVREIIMAMPPSKAPGYDKVPLSVVKDCLPHILPILTDLINSSFTNSVFPRAWKKAEVIPQPKDGDQEVADNNRPISLLPVLSKVAEKIALGQFNNYLTRNNRLTQHQSGNRKFYSTETLGLAVVDNIFKAMDEKKLTAMVMIYFSKAFDSISHDILLQKLRFLGTSKQACMWFKSYLTDRQQCTRVGTSISNPLTVTHGVPQGSILGSMLFSLYLNDLPTVVKHSNAESYVDDTKLYLSFPSRDINNSIEQLSEDLKFVTGWCCTNRLLVNPQKTELIIFGTRQLRARTDGVDEIRIKFLDQLLEPVAEVNDLGTILDSNLSCNEHVNSFMSSLLSTLYQVNRTRHLFSKNRLSPILQQLGWSPIEKQLILRDATQTYKIINGFAPSYLSTRLRKRQEVHRHNIRDIKIT